MGGPPRNGLLELFRRVPTLEPGTTPGQLAANNLVNHEPAYSSALQICSGPV